MSKGQVQVEFMIVVPVVALIVLGIIQYSALISARSSLSYASYSVARRIMMDPGILATKLNGEERKSTDFLYKLIAIKNLITSSPPLTEELFSSIEDIASNFGFKNRIGEVKKFKIIVEKYKSKGGEIGDLLDRALYAYLFSSVNFSVLKNVDIEKLKEGILKRNFDYISSPVPVSVEVEFRYPLIPAFGKLYCTYFTLSKRKIREKVNGWIDDEFNYLNLFISERINEGYSRVASAITPALDNFSDKLESILCGLNDTYSSLIENTDYNLKKINEYLLVAENYCGKITEQSRKWIEKINAINNELEGDIEYFYSVCMTAGEKEAKEVLTYFREITGKIVEGFQQIEIVRDSLKQYGSTLTDFVDSACQSVTTFTIPDLPRIDLPDCRFDSGICENVDVNLENYYPPSVSYEEYVAIFGVSPSAVSKYRKITSSVVDTLRRVNGRIDDVRDACREALEHSSDYCNEITSFALQGLGKIAAMKSNIEKKEGELLRRCGKVNGKISSFLSKISSLSPPYSRLNKLEEKMNNYLSLFKKNRAKFCGSLKDYLDQMGGFIHRAKMDLENVRGKMAGICTSSVRQIDRKVRSLGDYYVSFTEEIDSFLNSANSYEIDPERYMNEFFQEKLDKFWKWVYGVEDQVKGEVTRFIEQNIPDFPVFNIVNPKRCDPFLYYLGIYAVRLKARDVVPVNFLSLKGVNKSEGKGFH